MRMPKDVSTPSKKTDKSRTLQNRDSDDWPVSSITGLPRGQEIENPTSDTYSEISTWDGFYTVLNLKLSEI